MAAVYLTILFLAESVIGVFAYASLAHHVSDLQTAWRVLLSQLGQADAADRPAKKACPGCGILYEPWFLCDEHGACPPCHYETLA
jgi:hypothetical protein